MFSMNVSEYPYPSTRRVIYGAHGMAATSQPLAAQVGIDILKHGGNAVDAAIAMAAAMTVVEPSCNGIGGDNFAQIWYQGKLYGMNSSGFAPALADAESLRQKGYTSMPKYGMEVVTVPGAVKGWQTLHRKFGTLPFRQLLTPAINLAKEGFPVTPVIAEVWRREVDIHKSLHWDDPIYRGFFDTFTIHGKAPEAGAVWSCPSQAKTLESIADSYGDSFYTGELADRIDAFFRKYGGPLRKEDLSAFQTEMVEPVSVNYRGYDISEIPPNGHGIVALMALNILEGFSLAEKETTDTYHKQMEAMKLAYTDGRAYIADPAYMKTTVEQLLSAEYADRRRAMIGETALMPQPGQPDAGGTIYLCSADKHGNMVSLIQSNYKGFGSGIVIPDTGISLHDRGFGFSLDPASPNYLMPRKKPYHTIIPGFISKDGKAVGAFGVMGGYMQPQGHVQVISNMLDFHMNPQAALDAPRWQWLQGKEFIMEPRVPEKIVAELRSKGHEIRLEADYHSFGRGQIILRREDGVYIGGTEPRADGAVIGY